MRHSVPRPATLLYWACWALLLGILAMVLAESGPGGWRFLTKLYGGGV